MNGSKGTHFEEHVKMNGKFSKIKRKASRRHFRVLHKSKLGLTSKQIGYFCGIRHESADMIC